MIFFKGLNEEAIKVSLSQMAHLEFAFKYSGAKPKVYICEVCILVWADRGTRSDQSTISNLLIIEARWWVIIVSLLLYMKIFNNAK